MSKFVNKLAFSVLINFEINFVKIRFLLALLVTSICVNAQNKDSLQKREFVLDLPVFSFPYQLEAVRTIKCGTPNIGDFAKNYANSGMQLSLNLTSNLYTGIHWGINELFKVNERDFKKSKNGKKLGKRLLYSFTLEMSDLFLFYAPGFDSWLHEEYHRAVMSRFGVNSFNDMNRVLSIEYKSP